MIHAMLHHSSSPAIDFSMTSTYKVVYYACKITIYNFLYLFADIHWLDPGGRQPVPSTAHLHAAAD